MAQNQKIIKIGEVEFKVLYGDLLPKIKPEEYERLKTSIQEMGVLVAVITDENRGIIDGISRLEAASELKLKTVSFNILHGLNDIDKKHLAIKLNAQRRQMTQEERLALATDLRKDGLSFRQIAEIINVSYVTVGRILGTVTDVTVEFPDKITGKDGIQRPAKVTRNPKTCIVTKNIGEAKRVFDVCDGIESTDLPNGTFDVKRIEKIGRQTELNRKRSLEYQDLKEGQAELLLGDFRNRSSEIEDDSVDLCFTDPLYEKDALPVWGDLGAMCAKKLKPGGILMAYSGVMYLPQIHQILGEHMTYLWMAAIYHSGHTKLVRAVQIHQAWKPVLVYYKPPFTKYWHPFLDMVSGGQEKEHHHYEQSVSEAMHYIKALCPKNGTLLDPMMGSATTILAGLHVNLGLKCFGIEIDKAAFATAEQRVKKTIEQLRTRKKTA
ncbi:MAG: ParB/RepB/Spo0J family partition protein [Sedimentisphaerales bacterium]